MYFIIYLPGKRHPFFLTTKLDELTEQIICWRTIQNNRSQYPEACFSKPSPKKTLINRDALLNFVEYQHPQSFSP